MKKILLLLLVVNLFSNCKDDHDPVAQLATDTVLIEEWLDEMGMTAQKTASGIHYIIEDEGEGDEHPTSTSTVRVYYKGFFLNGLQFDGHSNGDPIAFNLQGVIAGWTEGIPLFKKGGGGKLLIPSGLAYGPNGTNGIPGNTVLMFEIDLISF